MQAADELLARFNVDQSARVDVFGVCEQADLWLTFRPLDSLLGAYIPTGSGGVIVTTRRSVAVQRYTVAHELGHWVLEHNALALDDEQKVYGSTHLEREQLAQLFADYFLLPLRFRTNSWVALASDPTREYRRNKRMGLPVRGV